MRRYFGGYIYETGKVKDINLWWWRVEDSLTRQVIANNTTRKGSEEAEEQAKNFIKLRISPNRVHGALL